jgi:hypothetical protein
MGRTQRMHADEKSTIQNVSWKIGREDITLLKWILKTGYVDEWIQLAQGKVRLRDLVNTITR